MRDLEHNENQENYYGTGSTRPPKSHRGVVAVLMILVIFLGGIVSMLSILNIKLFQQLEAQVPEGQDPVAYLAVHDSQAADASNDPQRTAGPVLSIAQTPETVDNTPEDGGLSLQEIYTRNIDSVVSVTCTLESGTTSGTGVVLTDDGYIVTNDHVIRGAKSIWVRFSDRRELAATVVGRDPASDLAVIFVQAYALKPAVFGDSSAVRVGDTVVAIGDPLGAQLSGTMTDGIISAINRDIVTGGRKMTLLQTNAALNAGNSGGPLINCYGQVIGINTMKISADVNASSVEGLGFAIPSLTVKEVVDQLMRQGYVSGRPTINITGDEVPALYRRYYGWPEGVYLEEVHEGGAAEAAGLQPGDIIVRLQGQRILNAEDLQEALYACTAGQQVSLSFYRYGRYHTVTVTVGGVQ